MRRAVLNPLGLAVARGLRAVVRARRRLRGPLRPSWSDDYETLATVLRFWGRRSAALPIAWQRRIAHAFLHQGGASSSTRFEKVSAGGVPAEWFLRDGSDASRVLLYLHGGGYCLGSVDSHRDFIARLCKASGFCALVPDYRLAPEHRWPAQRQDALACYRYLVQGRGVDPARIVIGGESAGGGLTVALLCALRDAGDPLPAGAALISPWVDLSGSAASIAQNERYDFIGKRQLDDCARMLLGEGDRAGASPLSFDLRGLPPLFIHAGGAEALLDDARGLADRARQAGVFVELEVWPDMIHAWHLFAGLVEEGRRAIERVARFLPDVVGR